MIHFRKWKFGILFQMYDDSISLCNLIITLFFHCTQLICRQPNTFFILKKSSFWLKVKNQFVIFSTYVLHSFYFNTLYSVCLRHSSPSAPEWHQFDISFIVYIEIKVQTYQQLLFYFIFQNKESQIPPKSTEQHFNLWTAKWNSNCTVSINLIDNHY